MEREYTDLKFCWKCGKMKPKDMMRPKFDSKGRRIGSQCNVCIKKSSPALMRRSGT